jgi:two-component system phosphate regulon sensor histidine kinase PhoR
MKTQSQVTEKTDFRLLSPLSSRWWTSLPFIVGVAVLVFMIWTSTQLIVYPYDGIGNLHPSGLITAIEPSSPAHNKLQIGDRILEVDQLKYEDVQTTYEGKEGGDQVTYLVDRGGELVYVTITLIDPPFMEIVVRFVPILVALVFWIIGMGVQTFKPADGAADLFFSWCQTSTMVLTAGVASYLGPLWASILFNALLWLLGPHSAHFHTEFPQPSIFGRRRRWLLALYGIAFLGIASILLTEYLDADILPWVSLLPSLVRGYLGLNLLIVVFLLYYNYTHPIIPGARGKVRLVALGGGLSGLSIVILTILPDALFHQPILPYSFTFLLLAIIPLTYGFAIYRLHLIEIERHVNRGAAYFLSYIILGGVYLILYAILNQLLPYEIVNTPLINAVIVLLLVILFTPLRDWVQRFVDTVFYGNWYDYRLGVMHVTRGLEEINELHDLANTVSERLVSTLNLEESCAFLLGLDGDFSIIHVASRYSLEERPQRDYPILPKSSLTYLLKLGAIERDNLRKELSEISVTPEEMHLLNSEQIHLWVPIIGHSQIQGLLALGPKLGGDVFSAEDLDILRILARQMGSIIENLHLLTRLRQHAAELELRVQERTEELHNSKERVEAILASVADGVFVTDLEFNIASVNPAFERQTGYSAHEILGQKLDTFLEIDEYPGLLSEIMVTLRQGKLWSRELHNRRKSGEKYDVKLTIAPIHDQNGRIVSYVGSQFDITHEKELERMKDAFVADVSHELRTPTTNIRLYLELLENAVPEKQKKYIDVIQDQSTQLVKLVEDILDLSRLTRLRKSEFSEVDLNMLVAQVVESNLPLANASGIQLVFEPYLELPALMGSREQIVRLITNLVSNAIRYTHEGEVRVTTLKFDDQICLQVSDTGIGIKDEDLPHIFDRFYRGGNVRLLKTPGTGLGLAIVKDIADIHEARVEVESELGRGTTFKVWLPINNAEEKDEATTRLGARETYPQ